ncbi:MAG: GtrA family protein, partial [Desulfovibrio sp.]|nr:GtrA family protein [Desulfovibrio sp.]
MHVFFAREYFLLSAFIAVHYAKIVNFSVQCSRKRSKTVQFPFSSPQYRELINYGFFGVLTTLINYLVYFFCLLILKIDYVTSNIIAWFLAVVFAFIT